MTYYQFLTNFNAEWSGKHRNVIYVCGGTDYIHVDVVRLLERRLWRPNFKKQVVHSGEFTGKEPSPAFLFSFADMKILFWEPDILEESSWAKFLRHLEKSYGVVIIIDEKAQLKEVFKKVYPKGSAGVLIDCTRLPTDILSFINLEIKVNMGETANLSDDVKKYLVDVPFDALFPIFNLLQYLGFTTVDVKEAKEYGLLTSNMELIYVKKLMKEGKASLFNYDFSNINEARFLRFTFYELVKLLQLKTMVEKRAMLMAQELRIPWDTFRLYYQPLARRLDLKTLYSRLYLVSSLLKWQLHPGISTMLLVYWR